MIDVRNILGSLMEAGLTPSSSRRVESALRSPQLGGLGGVLGQLAGAARDTKREAKAGNPVAVGGLGALAGAVLGGARGSSARGALGGAALALLGQVAWSALQGKLAGTAQAPEPRTSAGAAEPQSPDEAAAVDRRALILLQAMIGAAKADGQIDGREMERILGKLDEAGADQEAKDFVLAEMRRPLDLDALVAQAKPHGPELAAEVYAASLLAIEVDTPAERAYLERLATALGLDGGTRDQVHALFGMTTATAPG